MSVIYTFILDISEISDNVYIWVLLVDNESVIYLTFIKYMLYSYFTQNLIFVYFLEAKNPCFVTKIVQNLLIFVYLFCPKNSTTDFTNTFITHEWLIVESFSTHRCIAFLMLYRLVYNMRSYFNELILAWSSYLKTSWKHFNMNSINWWYVFKAS